MDKKNQKGSSLIEVLAVLSFISCLTIGVYSGISNVFSRFRLTKGVTEAKDSIKAMRDYFSSVPPLEELSTETLVKLGIFNDFFDDEKKYANNALGLKTEIKISGSYTSDFVPEGNDDPTFRLYYYDVPSRECLDLLLSDWGNDPSSGLVEIDVGGKKFRWTKDHSLGTGSYYTLPPDFENAQTSCFTETGTVTIYWEFFF